MGLIQRQYVLAQGFEPLRAEGNESVPAAFAVPDVDQHRSAVDVFDLQFSQFAIAHAGGVKNHQQGAVEEILGGVDEASNFLYGEDDGQPPRRLGIGDLVWSIGTLESFEEEEPQGGNVELDRAGFQLSFVEQISLVLAQMRLAQSVGGFSKYLAKPSTART